MGGDPRNEVGYLSLFRKRNLIYNYHLFQTYHQQKCCRPLLLWVSSAQPVRFNLIDVALGFVTLKINLKTLGS